MKRLLYFLTFIAFLGFGIWLLLSNAYILEKLSSTFRRLFVRPCENPITYRLDSIDQRFNLSEEEVLSVLRDAEAVWEEPTKRDLFTYSPKGDLGIHFIYDYRQETTDKLKALGFTLEDSKQSYDDLKVKYDALYKEYSIKKASFDVMFREFELLKANYDRNVSEWNSGDKASIKEYNRLQKERSQLESLQAKLKNLQDSLNTSIDSFNTVAHALNSLAARLNIQVEQYNTIGEQRGAEFSEGLYVSDATGRRITVFEFHDSRQLLRVLAHEMGHALGLNHTENKDDIMYRLNHSQNALLTSNDLSALEQVCK